MPRISRDAVIEAAAQLFSRNGFHATSMEDIARALTIKKPSLYHYFSGKEEILLAILETGMTRLISDLENIVATNEMTCCDKLRAAITTHAIAIATNPEGASIFLREDRGLGESYLRQYISWRDQFESLFRRILYQGVSSGEFRPIDVPVAVQALLGSINWMTRWYRADGRMGAAEIAEAFANIFLTGLARDQRALPNELPRT